MVISALCVRYVYIYIKQTYLYKAKKMIYLINFPCLNLQTLIIEEATSVMYRARFSVWTLPRIFDVLVAKML